MSESDMAAIIVVMLFVLIFFGGWAALIVFGIKAAKKKHRSPHWMWFGVHPVGALVVFIVMMVLEPLKVCPQCGRTSPQAARLCPFCANNFLPAAPGAPAGEPQKMCPQCGRANPTGANVCGYCAHSFAGPPAAPPAT